MGTRTFFSNSDFYSENNNVSQVYMYLHTKNSKKKNVKKNVIIVYAQTVLHFGASVRNPICYDLSFVFPDNLIWLLHCNAMHFASLLFLE
jgi:hypothetical protein